MRAAPRVLVGYASAAGSTREIAERIAERIGAAAEVVCRAAGPDVGVSGFDALVIGSAVHDMAWLPEATALLERAAGAGAPVWVFSVGGIEPAGPVSRVFARGERDRIAQAFPAGFAPRDHRVFRGVVRTTGVPLWGRLFWRLVGGRPGDRRNWPAIDAWAAGIAADLSAGRARISASGPPTTARQSPTPRPTGGGGRGRGGAPRAGARERRGWAG